MQGSHRENPQEPKSVHKSWNEFTKIDGKTILMKTVEIGIIKSTRKPTLKLPQTNPPAHRIIRTLAERRERSQLLQKTPTLPQ